MIEDKSSPANIAARVFAAKKLPTTLSTVANGAGNYLREAKRDNISLAVINPNLQGPDRTKPQKYLDLSAVADLSGENLFREI